MVILRSTGKPDKVKLIAQSGETAPIKCGVENIDCKKYPVLKIILYFY